MSGGVGGRNVTELGKRGSGPASSNCCSSVTTLRPAPFDRNGGKQWEVGPGGRTYTVLLHEGGSGGGDLCAPIDFIVQTLHAGGQLQQALSNKGLEKLILY